MATIDEALKRAREVLDDPANADIAPGEVLGPWDDLTFDDLRTIVDDHAALLERLKEDEAKEVTGKDGVRWVRRADRDEDVKALEAALATSEARARELEEALRVIKNQKPASDHYSQAQAWERCQTIAARALSPHPSEEA